MRNYKGTDLPLLVLAAVFGYLWHRTWKRRATLFLSAFPLAILTDIVRISSIFLVARFLSPRVGMYLWHDMAGYLVFMIAFLLLASISASIEDRAKKG